MIDGAGAITTAAGVEVAGSVALAVDVGVWEGTDDLVAVGGGAVAIVIDGIGVLVADGVGITLGEAVTLAVNVKVDDGVAVKANAASAVSDAFIMAFIVC